MLLLSESDMSGKFLSCIKGVKYRFEFQDGTWDFSLDAQRERASSCDDGGATWFFSSYGGILEFRRGIQDASCVGPGTSNLPLEVRRKAGECSGVTAGPIDLI